MSSTLFNGYDNNSYQNSPLSYNDSPSKNNVETGIEFGSDPSSNSILKSDFNKIEEIKKLLDSNKEAHNLEGMKRIITMISHGKDCSSAFPNVVKIIFSKNYEIKKLVYVYLTRYAEEQEDLALLSISSFQKALKDPNQLIRASALRVLSSIRIQSISPLVLLAIKESSVDISPYVRKTVAHAIPKLYSIDETLKEELVMIIAKLLGDRTTLVVGSAMMAFEEVCPERIDLIHINFRKICQLLMDVDEWGQVSIINTLTRYCRNQFPSPDLNKEKAETIDQAQAIKGAIPSEEDGQSETDSTISLDDNEDTESESPSTTSEDVERLKAAKDYDLLMSCTKPLLSSHNSSVVLSVCQLHFHCGTEENHRFVARALTRLLSNSEEIKTIVLHNIVTLSGHNQRLFENELKNFFVFSNDHIKVKLKKLAILVNLSNQTNCPIILRELQHYVNCREVEFVKESIRCIGRIAKKVPEMCEICLAGLVRLISKENEAIVSESIIVLRNLLQVKNASHIEIIRKLSTILDKVTLSNAKSAILWLVGEYSSILPDIASDILRLMAKDFPKQDISIKYQILTFGAKLYLANLHNISLLVRYIFEMAKYDTDYHLRDKARMLAAICYIEPLDDEPGNETKEKKRGKISVKAKKILLSSKPMPLTGQVNEEVTSRFRLGSMSHLLNHKVNGYKELDDWPLVPPNPNARDVPKEAAALSRDSSLTEKDSDQLIRQEPALLTEVDDFLEEKQSIHSKSSCELLTESEDESISSIPAPAATFANADSSSSSLDSD